MASYDHIGIGDPVDPGTGGGDGGAGGVGGGNAAAPGTGVFNLVFDKHEASSVLRIFVNANVSTVDDLQFDSYLVVDGVVEGLCPVNLILDTQASHGAMPIQLFAYKSGLAAGQHTIVVSIANHEPSGSLVVATGATVEITELKKGAL